MLHAARLLRGFCSRSRMTPALQVCAASILLASISLYARPSAHLTPFEQAQHLRQALEARPESRRNRPDYDFVLDAYRAIYHHDPASPKADASVLAVAELLTEEGLLFSDEKLLHEALVQYEFLRVQYPANPYRDTIVEGEKQARLDLIAINHAPARPPSPSREKHNAVLAAAIDSQQPHPAIATTPP